MAGGITRRKVGWPTDKAPKGKPASNRGAKLLKVKKTKRPKK